MKKYIKVSLPNGGELYYKKNKLTKATYTEIEFSSGSRVDTIPGLAHFSEHMFFTGTDKHTKQELNEIASKFGYRNAFTNWERIRFSGDFVNNQLADYFTYLEEIVNHSIFSEELVNAEKHVVIEEIKNHVDKHEQINNYLNWYNLYKQEFLNSDYLLLGTEKTVNSITSADVKNFVNKYFVANNMKAYIVSPMPLRKIKKLLIKNFYSKLKVDNKFTPLPRYYLPIKDDGFYFIKHEDIKKTYLNINIKINHGVGIQDKLWFNKYSLISAYIYDHAEGLIKKLRYEKNLVYGYSFYRETMFTNEGTLQFITECSAKNVNEIIKTVAGYLKDLVENGLKSEVIDRIKDREEFNLASTVPSIRKYLGRLHGLETYGKDWYGKLFNSKFLRKQKRNTTVEELNSMLKEFLTEPVVSATIYGDADKKDLLTKAQFKKLFKFNK